MKRYVALLWILILLLSTSQARSASDSASEHPEVLASQPRLVVWFGYLRLT